MESDINTLLGSGFVNERVTERIKCSTAWR